MNKGHVTLTGVWYNWACCLAYQKFCLTFFAFGISCYFFCHHRILILFGFNVVKGWLACQQFLVWVGYCSSNFGTFGSDNSTNLDCL